MLFLSTAETAADSLDILGNAWPAFSAEATAAGLTPVDGTGALSNAATPLPITAATKLVVAISVHNPINSARMAELVTALQTRPDLMVVAFLDGCCQVAANLDAFVTLGVNSIKPSTWPTIGIGSFINGIGPSYAYPGPLNTASPYSGSFTTLLPAMVGKDYSPLTGVPNNYVLYRQGSIAALPSAAPANVVGVLVPHAISNDGQGACLFLVGDSSQFTPTRIDAPVTEPAAIAQAFVTAATDTNGACGLQPITVAITKTASTTAALAPGDAVDLHRHRDQHQRGAARRQCAGRRSDPHGHRSGIDVMDLHQHGHAIGLPGSGRNRRAEPDHRLPARGQECDLRHQRRGRRQCARHRDQHCHGLGAGPVLRRRRAAALHGQGQQSLGRGRHARVGEHRDGDGRHTGHGEYGLACTNAGPNPAINATCTVTGAPAGATTVCSPPAPVASLAVNASITCATTFTPRSRAQITLTATAGSDTPDPNRANDTARVAIVPVATLIAPTTAAAIPTLSEIALLLAAALGVTAMAVHRRGR